MKIKTKFLLGISTLPILLLLLIGLDWNKVSNLNEMSIILQENYKLSSLSEEIYNDVKDEGIQLRNLVIFSDKENMQQTIIKLQNKSEAISQNIALLEEKVTTNEQKKLMGKLKYANNDFNIYKDEIVQLIVNNKKDEALALIDKESSSLHGDFYEILSDVTTIFDQNMEGAFRTHFNDSQREVIINTIVLSVGIILIMSLLFKSIWTLSSRLNKVSRIMTQVANGSSDLTTKVEDTSQDEIADVVNSFNRMAESLSEQMQKEQDLTWSKANIAEITTSLSGTQDLETLSQTFLSKVAPLVEASHAVFYVKDTEDGKSDQIYSLLGSYAFKERKHFSNTFKVGEGLIGQAVLEKSPIILTDVPNDYIRIQSGLGERSPLCVYVLPISFEGDVKAVLEMASLKPFTVVQQRFLEELIKDVGIILESVMGRIRLARLLEESQALTEVTQAQTEELQTQQEELRATNEELEEQTQALRDSEEKLQIQQEELEQTNANLEEKTKSLEEQNKQFECQNKEIENARAELEEKAKQLALSSKYKSEFLANMSHELRTPLNSLLILSKLLADNSQKNLSAKQVEFSRTIYSSGQDLLSLINDILDLAKIESGKMEVNLSNVGLADLAEYVESNFSPIAEEKNVNFNVVLEEDLPHYIYSDRVKIVQVLKNLLSNAFKFTDEGEVTLKVGVHSSSMLSFSVTDTGIGIPNEKQELIFEAFQQADGTTSRKYGGTGLGLSICREMAMHLGGEIIVKSEVGKGSTFTFCIGNYEEKERENLQVNEKGIAVSLDKPKEIEYTVKRDNSSHIKRMLIVDDDRRQRNSLMELIGDMDFVIKAVSTGAKAIEELKVNHFDCMILDLGLTDTSGFELLEKIMGNDQTENIKVFVYTGRDITSKEEIQLNKFAHTIIIKDEYSPQRLKDELTLYLQENREKTEVIDSFANKKNNITGLGGKKVLLVDDDVRNVYALSNVLEQYGMDISFAENGVEGLALIQKQPFDLVLMDIMMPEMDGYEAIRRIREIPNFIDLPIIALTAKAMKEDQEKCIAAGASDYIVKPVEPDQLLSLIQVWVYKEEGEK